MGAIVGVWLIAFLACLCGCFCYRRNQLKKLEEEKSKYVVRGEDNDYETDDKTVVFTEHTSQVNPLTNLKDNVKKLNKQRLKKERKAYAPEPDLLNDD